MDRPWFPYLCTEVEHWYWETQGDGHYNFWVAMDGEGYLTCDGQTFRLRPGAFFVFSPQQSVVAAHYSGPRITRFSAHFHPMCGGERQRDVAGLPLLGGQVPSLGPLKRRIDAIMRIAVRREDDRALAEQLFTLIAPLCRGEYSQLDLQLDPRIADSMHRFREDPASVGSMDQFAKELGISRSHFDREFARQVGESPTQFLLNCKMIRARRFLETSHLRVGEIAEALGYKDIYFFSRQFKAFSGRSPAHYRKSLESGAE